MDWRHVLRLSQQHRQCRWAQVPCRNINYLCMAAPLSTQLTILCQAATNNMLHITDKGRAHHCRPASCCDCTSQIKAEHITVALQAANLAQQYRHT
jgi:hypothetical protein